MDSTTKGADMTEVASRDAMYVHLRGERPDWTANEAALVAAYWPALSPKNGGTRNPIADRQAEEIVERQGTNPVIRETPLVRMSGGWIVREYADGTFDATDGIGLSPGFKSFDEVLEHVRDEVTGV
jgi:hypothetical protein